MVTEKRHVKMFLNIPSAAELAGFSLRHFRRVMQEDAIPVVQIGHRYFILWTEFQKWKERRYASLATD